MPTLELRADAERMRDLLTNDELILVFELDKVAFRPEQYRSFVEVLSKFVWQDDEYLDYEQARPLVGKLTFTQTVEAIRGLRGKMKEVAVPPTNGGVSATRSNSKRRSRPSGSSRSTRRANGAPRPGS